MDRSRPVRVVVAIPHAFVLDGPKRYRSHTSAPEDRTDHVSECLESLARLRHTNILFFNLALGRYIVTPQVPMLEVEIVICAAQDHHLIQGLDETIDRTGAIVTYVPGDPMMLGFACHAALAERIGDFDFFCYLEDDLAIRDGSFFVKLAWFHRRFGSARVLLPHRYEVHGSRKLYVDGDLPDAASKLLPSRSSPTLTARWMDDDVQFVRPGNPHSGCFFLSGEQMRAWMALPIFLDLDTTFVDPLASAASLGVYTAFDVYKPGPEHASFAEIEHVHRGHSLDAAP